MNFIDWAKVNVNVLRLRQPVREHRPAYTDRVANKVMHLLRKLVTCLSDLRDTSILIKLVERHVVTRVTTAISGNVAERN